MKNKNQRDLQKYWAEQAAKKGKPGKKKLSVREDRNQAAKKAATAGTES